MMKFDDEGHNPTRTTTNKKFFIITVMSNI